MTVTRFGPDGERLPCNQPECDRPVLARGLCSAHYQRLQAGRPLDQGRNQRRERNNGWRGDQASYHAFHDRVRRDRGTPAKCERCGIDDPGKRYEWANLTGNYQDIDDYQRMCKSCHQRFDLARRGLPPIKHGTSAGAQQHRKRGETPCEPCRVAQLAYQRAWYQRQTEKRAERRSKPSVALKVARQRSATANVSTAEPGGGPPLSLATASTPKESP